MVTCSTVTHPTVTSKQDNVGYEKKLNSKGVILQVTMKKYNLSQCYFHNYKDKLLLFASATTGIRY